MTKKRDLLPSKSSFAALILLLLAILLYFVAFYSNEWFIVGPSHYGIWSVTFCDILTCQSIPTIFNDQPGWYLFVQAFNMVGLGLTLSSFVMVFTTLCTTNRVACSTTIISTSCHIAVCSTIAGMVVFYTSLTQDNQMSCPSISWCVTLASASAVMQISAIVVISL